MAELEGAEGYRYENANPTWANAYLWPTLAHVIKNRFWQDRRAFDLGCGNGATADFISRGGFEVTAVDPSPSGIALAKDTYPHVKAEIGDAYDDLAGKFGTFPLVVSLEVIEHCYEPRKFMGTFMSLIASGGVGVLSTPYHGYWKNLALALADKWDEHHSPLWDGGHIKFFSVASLHALFKEFSPAFPQVYRIGRIPALAKSMMFVITKP